MELFLDGVKQELPELTKQINITTLSRVDEYFTKLEQDLKIQKKLLQENIQNEINKGIEMEYEIPRHALIDDSVPYIQFKKELYTTDENVDNFYFGLQERTSSINDFIWTNNIKQIQRLITKKHLFKINTNLHSNEFVVYIKLKCLPNWFFDSSYMAYGITVDISYITNYGRFINIFENLYQETGHNSKYYSSREKLNEYSHNIETPLTYKMPAIFTKIIDAIYKEDTTLLQECCSEYHSKIIENKRLKEENKMILETIKQPYEDMKPKYEMLEKENTEIKLENARLKKELELMQIKIDEIHKLYLM
jgi:hypothetical protein